ncbi:MAG TPA: alpha/beta hydrolase-fold protein, partial [Pyrinomonadaceae bacterium]|nr:alpha/beta hydrolase-fold protein [Pyrinomonadaceae bacterium]
MTKILNENLQSKLLQRDIPYRVILPKNYETNENRYPVLYLLHGLFGSCENWLELTNLKNYVLGKEIIIILVDGENGWYSDSKTVENDKFESYFLQ